MIAFIGFVGVTSSIQRIGTDGTPVELVGAVAKWPHMRPGSLGRAREPRAIPALSHPHEPTPNPSSGGVHTVSVIRFPSSDEGPSAADLAEIEAEWPLIAAELDLLDAEIALIAAGPDVSALDRRRVRRAARRVLAVGWGLADSRGLAAVDAEFGAEGVA